jgi:hypothetical protein
VTAGGAATGHATSGGAATAGFTFILGPPADPTERRRFDSFQDACRQDLACAVDDDAWAGEERRSVSILFELPEGAAPSRDPALSSLAEESIYVTRYSHWFRKSRELWCSTAVLDVAAPESDGAAGGPLASSHLCKAAAALLGSLFERSWVEWRFVPTGNNAGAAEDSGFLDVGAEGE